MGFVGGFVPAPHLRVAIYSQFHRSEAKPQFLLPQLGFNRLQAEQRVGMLQAKQQTDKDIDAWTGRLQAVGRAAG